MADYCTNCKHLVMDIPLEKSGCGRPTLGKTLVSGRDARSPCNYERTSGFLVARLLGKCGKEGRFFEEEKNG